MASEKRRYIRKNDSPHILPWTDALAARSDMYECDEKGAKVEPGPAAAAPASLPPVHLRDHAEPGKPTTESKFMKEPEAPAAITTLQPADEAAKAEAKAASDKAKKAAKAEAK